MLFALHMFLMHQRFVFVYVLLVPMAIIRDMVPQDSRLSLALWEGQPRDFVESLAIRRFNALAGLLLIAAIAAPLVLLRNAVEPPSDVFAGKAIRFAQDNMLPGNVLNDYDFGGSLSAPSDQARSPSRLRRSTTIVPLDENDSCTESINASISLRPRPRANGSIWRFIISRSSARRIGSLIPG